jgi:hypothetical protein
MKSEGSQELEAGLSLLVQRPPGSAHLYDIKAGDDAVMNRIGALIGVDGAVGLRGRLAGR